MSGLGHFVVFLKQNRTLILIILDDGKGLEAREARGLHGINRTLNFLFFFRETQRI